MIPFALPGSIAPPYTHSKLRLNCLKPYPSQQHTGFFCYRPPPSLHADESRITKEAWFEQLPTFTTAKRIASANELCKGHILGNLA